MILIQAIEKLITDYSKRGDRMGIDELLKLRDRLAGSSYYFAAYTAELKSEYNLNYFLKKIHVLRETMNSVKGGSPMNRSEMEANLGAEELIKKELESEANSYKADLLLKQINRVLEAMNQRLSYLKSEKEQSYGRTEGIL